MDDFNKRCAKAVGTEYLEELDFCKDKTLGIQMAKLACRINSDGYWDSYNSLVFRDTRELSETQMMSEAALPFLEG